MSLSVSASLPPIKNPPLITPGQDPPLITINNGDKVVFQIDKDGTLSYTKDGKLCIVTEERELSLILVIVISEISGFKQMINKDEIITRIITNYREGRLNNLLG